MPRLPTAAFTLMAEEKWISRSEPSYLLLPQVAATREQASLPGSVAFYMCSNTHANPRLLTNSHTVHPRLPLSQLSIYTQ